jgi:hypothetical protein
MSETSFTGKFFESLSYYIMKSFLFIFLLALFVTNLLALSLSIKCNKNEPILFKIASGMYAFMFGILYIFINYYLYRLQIKNNPCVICGNPFKPSG